MTQYVLEDANETCDMAFDFDVVKYFLLFLDILVF